jgi:ABC-type multidrug transport system ATPase subunit
VRLKGVRAGYGQLRRRVVLDGVDLAASSGQVTAIVGPNGAGKTTLFRVLLGFITPWEGQVDVAGRTPRQSRGRHGVGYLPESVTLPAGFTLGGLLREGARLAGMRGSRAETAIEAALESSGLGAAYQRPLSTFSKGMGRRAALAYVTLGAPPLLLLDEPLSGLDPRSRARLRETIEASADEATVLLASHDLSEVQRMAHVVLILDQGRVVRRLEAAELADADLERIVLEADPSE